MTSFLKQIVLLSLLACFNYNFAQENTNKRIILPSLMVIPRTNEGQDLRTMIDDKPELRVGMATVKDGFDKYGYDTKDFETTFKKVMTDPEIWSYTQSELKDLLFKNITADIIVELDVNFIKSNQGNMVRIITEANVLSSGNSLASKVCESNKFYTDDVGALINNSLKKCFGDFLQTIEGKWANECDLGRTVNIDFSFDEESELTMESKMENNDDLRLKYVIEDWLTNTALDSYVKIPTMTELNLFAEDYRYECIKTPSNIERNLYRFFDRLDIAVKIVNNRGSIYVNITQ